MKRYSIYVVLVFNLMSFYGCKNSDSNSFSSSFGNEKKATVTCSKMQFYDYENNICVDNCEASERYDSTLKKCVKDQEITKDPIRKDGDLRCKGNTFLDIQTKECVPGRPLAVFSKEKSILSLWGNTEELSVCVDVENEIFAEVSDGDYQDFASEVKMSLKKWILPLIEENYSYLNADKKVSFYKKIGSRCDQKNEDIIFHLSTKKTLKKICNGNLACAHVDTRQIWLQVNDEPDTYLHELGHLFGFDDHYIKGYGDTPCMAGYAPETTIMCASESYLKAADIEGIKRQYCRIWPQDEKCQKVEVKELTDIANGPMMTCKIPGMNRSISVINNYIDTKIVISQISDGKIIKSYEKVPFIGKLDASLWVFKAGDAEEILKIDWANKKLFFEVNNEGDLKMVEAMLSKDMTTSSDSNLTAVCETHEFHRK